MAQAKILIDTNSYLRLAQSINPLLFNPFGAEKYCLYIIKELNEELGTGRLASKFHWVNDEEYVGNRRRFPSISRKQRKNINDNFDYIWSFIKTECPGPSKVDALYIAHALELQVPIVTDDKDMSVAAEAFEVRVLTTLELLKLMVDADHVTLGKVRGVIRYWQYIGDTPCSTKELRSEFRRLFGRMPDV